MARSSRRLGLALALAGAVLALDQASKWLVRQQAAQLPYRFGGGLRIELSLNPGISFGRFAGAGEAIVVLVAGIVVGVGAALVMAPPRYRPALGIIMGGALGNLLDRLRLDGAVVDFIGVYVWPTFNLADVAVVVGTALLAWEILRGWRR